MLTREMDFCLVHIGVEFPEIRWHFKSRRRNADLVASKITRTTLCLSAFQILQLQGLIVRQQNSLSFSQVKRGSREIIRQISGSKLAHRASHAGRRTARRVTNTRTWFSACCHCFFPPGRLSIQGCTPHDCQLQDGERTIRFMPPCDESSAGAKL